MNKISEISSSISKVEDRLVVGVASLANKLGDVSESMTKEINDAYENMTKEINEVSTDINAKFKDMDDKFIRINVNLEDNSGKFDEFKSAVAALSVSVM